MKKKSCFYSWGGVVLVVLFFAATICADELTSIEKATHIIRGIIESTEAEFAGGIVPITSVMVRVNEIAKNNDNSIVVNGIIKILVYGCETSDNVVTTSDEELILFKKGQEIIVPLKKYYEHYRMFDLSDPFALTYVSDKSIAGFDESRVKEPENNTSKQQYFLHQQQKFKNRELMRNGMIRNSLHSDRMLKKSTQYLQDRDFKDAKYFMSLVATKAHNSSINIARNASAVIKVKVKTIRPSQAGGDALEMVLEGIKNIKGTGFSKEIIVPLMDRNSLRNRGWVLPNIGDKGLILLDHNRGPVNSPDFFIKDDNGGLLIGGNEHISEQNLLQLLSEGN